MVKYVVLAAAMMGTFLLADQADARHRRGCAGGSCYAGGYYGGYAGGCPGGVCGVPVAPAYPVYPAAPVKAAAVAPVAPPVAVAPATPAPAPVVVAQPNVRYYYTNTGRFGWRRGR